MYSERLSEQLAVVGTIDPDAYTAATYTTDEIEVKHFRRILFVVMAGALGTSATLDFSVKGGATSNAGSHSTTVTGKSITQLTQAGSDSDKQVLVEVTAEECAAQGLNFIEGSMVVGTATSDAGVLVVADNLRYSTGADYDLSTVDEIVA